MDIFHFTQYLIEVVASFATPIGVLAIVVLAFNLAVWLLNIDS